MENQKFASRWQWFNNLIADIELSEEQFKGMFNNLTPAELKVWIAETKCCYPEGEAEHIETADELAEFYYDKNIIL